MKKVRRPQKVKSLKHAINERFLNYKKTTYTSTYFLYPNKTKRSQKFAKKSLSP